MQFKLCQFSLDLFSSKIPISPTNTQKNSCYARKVPKSSKTRTDNGKRDTKANLIAAEVHIPASLQDRHPECAMMTRIQRNESKTRISTAKEGARAQHQVTSAITASVGFITSRTSGQLGSLFFVATTLLCVTLVQV